MGSGCGSRGRIPHVGCRVSPKGPCAQIVDTFMGVGGGEANSILRLMI